MKKSANNFCINTGYFDFLWQMLNYNLYARGVSTRYCGSPDTIKPNRCSVNIAQGRGGMGEQALSPPLSYQHLEYHINGKGIQQSHKIKKIHLSNQKYDGGTGNNSAEHQRIKRPCF
jgi:hypothetical protein